MHLINGSHYSQQVRITDEDAHDEYSVESKCEFKIGLRYKETIHLAPSLKPTRYWDRIIAYANSTRRRHVSGVEYWPRTKLVSYAETVYAYPKRVENSFLSTLTRHSKHTTWWYKTTMDLEPRVFRAPSIESPTNGHEPSLISNGIDASLASNGHEPSLVNGAVNGINGFSTDSD